MAVLLWKRFRHITNPRLLQQRAMSLYNHTHGFEEDAVKKKLQQFPGGSIDLSKGDNCIGILTMNNPKFMNAFTGTMMVELQEKVAELENWKNGKGLIVRGAENTFCSGSDLNAVMVLSQPQDGMDMCMFMQNTLTRLMRIMDGYVLQPGVLLKAMYSNPVSVQEICNCTIHRLPLITVALIQGKALGGGAELTTACDFRLMTPESEIRFVHKQMGLVPGWGGGARLVQILGSSPALKLLSGATRVNPESALRMGLIETVLPSSSEADSLEAARTWLKHYTKGPAEVLQAIKRVVSGGRDLPLEAALRTEKDIFGTVWGGPANVQALAQKTKHK